MRKSKGILIGVAAVLIAAVAFAGWYRWAFAMREAATLEVNDPGAAERVLIATQGSAFKDAVVAQVSEYLKRRGAHARVIDVSRLPEVRAQDWTAIVILHTWEMGKPPPAVAAFIDGAADRGNIVALATSGAGTFRIDGVDAMSSASRMAEAPLRAGEIIARLERILDAAAQASATSP
jgi:hypothetical protein